MTVKHYPDKTFETEMRKRGFNVQLCWQIKGPPHTGVTWITGYFINNPGEPAVHGSIVLHQSYKPDGWEVYTPNRSVKIEDTISDVIERISK